MFFKPSYVNEQLIIVITYNVCRDIKNEVFFLFNLLKEKYKVAESADNQVSSVSNLSHRVARSIRVKVTSYIDFDKVI